MQLTKPFQVAGLLAALLLAGCASPLQLQHGIAIPLAHVGDEAVYRYQNGDETGLAILRIFGAETILDAGRQPILAARVEIREQTANLNLTSILWVGMATGRVIARLDPCFLRSATNGSCLEEWSELRYTWEGSTWALGASPFHGRLLRPAERTTVELPTATGPVEVIYEMTPSESDPPTIRAVPSGQTGLSPGFAGLTFANATLWMTGGRPFPAAVEAHHPDLPHGPTVRLDLDSFTAGTGPAIAATSSSLERGPSLDVTWDAPQHGLPQEGVPAMPFPLDEALQVAFENDTGLRGFLRTHREARLGRALFSPSGGVETIGRVLEERDYRWDFRLDASDGTSHETVVQQTDAYVAGMQTNRTRYVVSSRDMASPEGTAGLVTASLPDRFATIASAIRALEQGGAPPGWDIVEARGLVEGPFVRAARWTIALGHPPPNPTNLPGVNVSFGSMPTIGLDVRTGRFADAQGPIADMERLLRGP